jgi:hypothetical protein
MKAPLDPSALELGVLVFFSHEEAPELGLAGEGTPTSALLNLTSQGLSGRCARQSLCNAGAGPGPGDEERDRGRERGRRAQRGAKIPRRAHLPVGSDLLVVCARCAPRAPSPHLGSAPRTTGPGASSSLGCVSPGLSRAPPSSPRAIAKTAGASGQASWGPTQRLAQGHLGSVSRRGPCAGAGSSRYPGAM